MMKVLEKGREQKGWSCEHRCTGRGNGGGGCEALLLVEQPDLFHTSSSARDEVTDYVTFECSECGVWTDLNSEQERALPRRVFRGLRHRSPGDSALYR